MDYDTFDTDVFSEINDMPGEIYDVIEYKEEGEDDNLNYCELDEMMEELWSLSNTYIDLVMSLNSPTVNHTFLCYYVQLNGTRTPRSM